MSASIRLTSEQQETLARLSAQSGKPWQEVLGKALASFEQQIQATNGTATETVHAAMVRLGLLGCVTDGPVDLSTNPKYMEGFGSHCAELGFHLSRSLTARRGLALHVG
jgi:hypothetical protein